MSRIVALRTRVVSRPLHTPFVTALRSTDTTDAVLVEVDGQRRRHRLRRGAAGLAGHRRVAGRAQACLTGPLPDVVLGVGTDDLPDLLSPGRRRRRRPPSAPRRRGRRPARPGRTPGAASPLPCSSAARSLRVPTDVTLAAGDADSLAAAARARVADGFTALKLKVGTDAATDVARVRAVRDAVGPDVAIRLDANQGWTPRRGGPGDPGARGRRPRRRARRAAGAGRRPRRAGLGHAAGSPRR